MRIALLALWLVAVPARADEAADAYEQLHAADRALRRALVGGGAANVVAGATLCGFSRYDHHRVRRQPRPRRRLVGALVAQGP